jgi:hypothetical protein
MQTLPTLHLKVANSLIVYMNSSGLTAPDKLTILRHVREQIIRNLGPDERRELAATQLGAN